MLLKIFKLQEQQMADIWEVCKETDPDLILYHMKASFASDFAEKLGVPCMQAFWIPMHVPTTRLGAARRAPRSWAVSNTTKETKS